MGKGDNKKKRMRTSLLVVSALACAVIVGILMYHAKDSSKAKVQEGERQEGERQGTPGFAMDGVSVQSGTLTANAVDQPFSLSNDVLSRLGLVVEEVCVSEGDVVKQGDPLLKVTQASYKQAKDLLERELASAKTGQREAELNYQKDKVNLNLTYQNNQNLKSTAADEYSSEQNRLANDVSAAKEKLSSAQSIVSKYAEEKGKRQSKLNSYKEKQNDYNEQKKDKQKKVEDGKKEAAQAEGKYTQALNEVNSAKAALQTISAYASAANQSEATTIQQLQTYVQEELKEKEKSLEGLKKESEAKKKVLQEAEAALAGVEKKLMDVTAKVTSLNKEIEDKKMEWKTAKSELSGLELAYQEALNKQKTELVTLRAKYKEDSLLGSQAQSSYEVEKAKLESALQEARDAHTTAKEAYETFQNEMGDTYLYASREGTIASVGYRSGFALTAQNPVASYYDESVLRVTISVDQSEINSHKVGDEASLSIGSTRGNFVTGTIETIEAARAANASVSQVSYNVTLCMDNAEGSYTSGQTATVMFGTFGGRSANP